MNAVDSVKLNNNPYHSFAPVRHECDGKFFIDGKIYFEEIADALESATVSVPLTRNFPCSSSPI